jgi:adenylate kinase
MNLVFLGPPGAGKGTQAKTFAAKRGLAHVSTGDMFRAAAAAGTPLGNEARRYMERGELVPDDVVCGLVRDRISQPDCARGFILDGFPRTVNQALSLERDLQSLRMKPVACVDFRIDRRELMRRLTARQTCRKCGAAYNTITNPSRKAGVCDACGGETYLRDDDRPETVERRLTEYDMKTAPLIEFYAGRSALLLLDASGTPGAVSGRLDGIFSRPEHRAP